MIVVSQRSIQSNLLIIAEMEFLKMLFFLLSPPNGRYLSLNRCVSYQLCLSLCGFHASSHVFFLIRKNFSGLQAK